MRGTPSSARWRTTPTVSPSCSPSSRPTCRRSPTRFSSTRSPSRTPRDRKSTRLNSSHDQISYAVFCLKKKKNNQHGTHLHPHLVLTCAAQVLRLQDTCQSLPPRLPRPLRCQDLEIARHVHRPAALSPSRH